MTSSTLSARLRGRLEERRPDGLFRQIEARAAQTGLIDLSNNDYLRLARNPALIKAARESLDVWGASSSASPLVSGYTEGHRALEERLAHWAGFRWGLVWNSGYAANHGVLSVLPSKGDLILIDRLAHYSMIAGALRSGARVQRFRHNDVEQLEHLLVRSERWAQVFVVTESVYSMDGDRSDLQSIAALKERFGFTWILDEAHALGWYGARGSGLAEEEGVTDAIDVFVGTLGKALGSMGAFTLFHQSCFREFLINFAGEFIYSTYLPPSCAAAALAAVNWVEAQSEERVYGHKLSAYFRERLPGSPPGDSPIVPVIFGEAVPMLRAAQTLAIAGFKVASIRPPTVPAGKSRLRISLNTALAEDDLDRLVAALEDIFR